MPAVAVRNGDNIAIGPGHLYVAALGTAEPTNPTAVLPSASWRDVGYTEDGTSFKYTATIEAIEVAEEFDPVGYRTTARDGEVSLSMAEATAENLALALNLGAAAGGYATDPIEPPAPNAEVRVMICLQTDIGSMWLWRKAIQGGDMTRDFKKAPAKGLLPVTFKLEKPTGKNLFAAFRNAAGIL